MGCKEDEIRVFSNKFAMMISKENHGEYVNWATIMYSQLVKKLIKWEKCKKNMIKGTTKRELNFFMPICHSFRSSISEMVSIRRSKATKEKKGEFEREVHKKQKTSKPYTHLS